MMQDILIVKVKLRKLFHIFIFFNCGVIMMLLCYDVIMCDIGFQQICLGLTFFSICYLSRTFTIHRTAKEFRCSHLNFIYRACFEQGVP